MNEQVRLDGLLFSTDAQVLPVMNQILDGFAIQTDVCTDERFELRLKGTNWLSSVVVQSSPACCKASTLQSQVRLPHGSYRPPIVPTLAADDAPEPLPSTAADHRWNDRPLSGGEAEGPLYRSRFHRSSCMHSPRRFRAHVRFPANRNEPVRPGPDV